MRILQRAQNAASYDRDVLHTPPMQQLLHAVLLLTLLTTYAPARGTDSRLGEEAGAAGGRLTLIRNEGQWDTPAAFVGELGSLVVRLERDAILLQRQVDSRSGHLVRLGFVGASDAVALEGRRLRPGTYNYFIGSDADGWRTGVRAYAEVVYEGLYPDVDLVLREERGSLKYDLVLREAGDLEQVVLEWQGVEDLFLGADGELVAETAGGRIVQPAPRTWQESSEGERHPVECGFRRIGERRFGFEVLEPDATLPLVVDPGLEWATYLGSGAGGLEEVNAVVIDPAGSVTVGGHRAMPSFPTTPGAFQSPSSVASVFITRFDPTGSQLVYSSLIGGSGMELNALFALAVDARGRAVAGGETAARDFPTTPGALSRSLGGLLDAYVLRLSPDGSALEYSTFLGGPSGEGLEALAIADSGAVVAAGSATVMFPTTPGAFDTTTSPLGDIFVVRLDPTGGSLEWSTLLGGASSDVVTGLALDATEAVTLCGIAGSPDFPATPGAYDTVWDNIGSGWNAFVTRLSPDGSALEWSTFLDGGPGTFQKTEGLAVAVDRWRRPVVVGMTFATGFPVTPAAFGQKKINARDAFVTYLDEQGASLRYSTFLGGMSDDLAMSVSVDASGIVTVGGKTRANFPVTDGAWLTVNPVNDDMFLTRLSPRGDRLFYSTYVGTNERDEFGDMDVRPTGQVVVAGETFSSQFPTTPGAFMETFAGGSKDIIVAEMSMLPEGVERIGVSTPSCLGPLSMAVTVAPLGGAPGFSVYCSAAPPNGTGVLAVAAAPASPGPGRTIWLDLAGPHFLLPVHSGASGYVETHLALPAALTGRTFYAQYLFLESGDCPGPPAASASNALSIEIQ